MLTLQKIIGFFLRKKWLGLLVLAAFFIGVGISTYYRGAISPKQRTDLTVYLKAAEMININRADHIYGIENHRHWHYVYSPLLAILLTPFQRLPLGVNVLMVYLFSVVALLGTLGLSRAFFEKTQPANWQITLSAIFCIPLFLNTLSRAQLGILMLFFTTACFYTYLKNWKFITGLLLGFAITLKISPLSYLIFFFLFKKEWKILTSTFLSLIFFLFIYPSMILGVRQNWELLKIWQDLMSLGSLDKAYTSYLWNELFTPFAADNQSLYAVMTRLVWHSEKAFVGASNNLIRTLTSSFGLLLLALLFWKRLPAKPAASQDRVQLLAEYSLYPMLMLFASPVSQIHHFTNLYLLFLGAILLTPRYPVPSKTHLLLLFSIWITAVFIVMGFILEKPLGYMGVQLWGSMFLWGVVLFSLSKNPGTQT